MVIFHSILLVIFVLEEMDLHMALLTLKGTVIVVQPQVELLVRCCVEGPVLYVATWTFGPTWCCL